MTYKIDESRSYRIMQKMKHAYVWYLDTNEKIWLDTGNLLDNESKSCNYCNQKYTDDGHDPCIANLPGVKFACCGHGEEPGYILFENGLSIYGKFTNIVENDYDSEKQIYNKRKEIIFYKYK